MERRNYNIEEAVSFIERANYLIDHKKVKEDVVRHNFTSYIARIYYSDPPTWIRQHISGGESLARFATGGAERMGFIDNLVGLSVIEYERDLRITGNFNEGYNQIKQYCASRINDGHPSELVIGILSDTVRWYAYKVSNVSVQKKNKILGPEDLILEKLDEVTAVATTDSARVLMDFLETYLGRMGARPLNAISLAEDFGFESSFSRDYVDRIGEVIQNAIETNENYAKIISKLWNRVITDKNIKKDEFDFETYRDELYMITLGKLICANILEQKALVSSTRELADILRGGFFERKGITNMVEYDYFGWINTTPYLVDVIVIAKEIQENLKVYDFEHSFTEDLFGNMFSQLANRTKRILLGQEWTPHWLSNKMVQTLFEGLDHTEMPQFVDMCCGSGVMIVETIKSAKVRINSIYPTKSKEEKIHLLSNSITGFDIDPLAVMLSKISWIIAAKDWLKEVEGVKVTIPIYHADSLFAVTPLNNTDNTSGYYNLEIGEETVKLPRFILTPEYQSFFDSIIDKGYKVALHEDRIDEKSVVSISRKIIRQELEQLNLCINEEVHKIELFLTSFIQVVNNLHIEGRNGIWAYIIKNSYRPGLVTGQFNGMITNPPWLALSKLGNNPYKEILKSKARHYNINPPGPAFLHIELATIFLLHGVKNYLRDEAVIACIVPDSVMNGRNHNPFRIENYNKSTNPVGFQLQEIWQVAKGTFKNEAIVILGQKGIGSNWVVEDGFKKISGKLISEEKSEEKMFYENKMGDRTSWYEEKLINSTSIEDAGNFRQGADIMPRTFYCYDINSTNKDISRVETISLDSDKAFVISGVKTEGDFTIDECYIENDAIYDVYTSNLLTPFIITDPINSVLPIRKNKQDYYELIPYEEVVIRNDDLQYIVDQIGERRAEYIGNWERLNTRNKLNNQSKLPLDGFYVFVGTSGSSVCGAYKDANDMNVERTIIDQTLNWVHIQTEDEALYLTGLMNSEAIDMAISIFQPRGQQGQRHIHSLPYEVTPKYDPTNAVHQQVVENTELLLSQYNRLKMRDSSIIKKILPQNGSLARRRTYSRNKIKSLENYSNYEKACRIIYNLS